MVIFSFLVIVTVTNIANAENYEFCKDPICTINYLNGTSKELSCNADFSDFEDRGMKVSDECEIDSENLPSFDYAEFSKTTQFNRCTENSICFGTFSNGTQIKIQCEDRVYHGCGPILFDSPNMLYKSPLKQFKSGSSFNEIQCKENLVLIQKYDNSPACVMPQTKIKLIERGWAINPIDPNRNTSYDLSYEFQSQKLMINEIIQELHNNGVPILGTTISDDRKSIIVGIDIAKLTFEKNQEYYEAFFKEIFAEITIPYEIMFQEKKGGDE